MYIIILQLMAIGLGKEHLVQSGRGKVDQKKIGEGRYFLILIFLISIRRKGNVYINICIFFINIHPTWKVSVP